MSSSEILTRLEKKSHHASDKAPHGTMIVDANVSPVEHAPPEIGSMHVHNTLVENKNIVSIRTDVMSE